MGAPLDLRGVGRAELASLVLVQRDQIADLGRRLACQEEELAAQWAATAPLSERLGAALARIAPSLPEADRVAWVAGIKHPAGPLSTAPRVRRPYHPAEATGRRHRGNTESG